MNISSKVGLESAIHKESRDYELGDPKNSLNDNELAVLVCLARSKLPHYAEEVFMCLSSCI